MIAKVLSTFKQPVRLLLEVLVLLVKVYFIFLWKIFRIFIPKSLRFSDGLQSDLILVTGCGNDLTRHVVLKLAEMGASLVLWDNEKEVVRSVAEEAESYGTQVYPFVCDCSDQDAIYSTAKKVQQEVGNISILINSLNSDSSAGQDIMSMDDARLAQVMKTNFYSNYWTTKAFLPWMVDNDYGHIVNMVTQPLFCGLAGNSDRVASKAAVLAFSEALRSELVLMEKSGVHVVCVYPWKENYNITELPKMAEQVIEAMLEQEPFVTLPRYKYLLIVLKCILPSGVLNLISKFMNKHSQR